MPEALALIPAPMFSPQQLSHHLGISRRCLQTWASAGKLPSPDLREGRVLRWKPETIDKWLKERGEQ